MTDVTGVAIRVQPGALHSAAGLRPAGSISVSPVLLFQIKACALIWGGRRKERICSFRGAYSNRGNGMQRVSSDVGGCGFPRQCAHWLGMTRYELRSKQEKVLAFYGKRDRIEVYAVLLFYRV